MLDPIDDHAHYRPDRLDPVTGRDEGDLNLRHVVVHGYRRAFRMAGRGPVLLFIHGIGDSSTTWLDVLPALAERFTVIAPDLLGHGGSDKPRADYAAPAYACGMRDLLSVLDIDTATVVGHSLGGGVAMQFAYQFPERCERLVLVDTGGVSREVHPLLKLAAMPGAELLLPLVTAPPARLMVSAAAPLLRAVGGLGVGPDLPYVLDRYHRLADATARAAFLRTLRSVVDWHGQVVTMLDRSYLAAGIPTLLMWGDRDRVVPSTHAELAHRAIPHSRLVMFEGSGHFPHKDDPLRFVDLVIRFHTSTLPADHDPARWRALLRTGRPGSPLHYAVASGA